MKKSYLDQLKKIEIVGDIEESTWEILLKEEIKNRLNSDSIIRCKKCGAKLEIHLDWSSEDFNQIYIDVNPDLLHEHLKKCK